TFFVSRSTALTVLSPSPAQNSCDPTATTPFGPEASAPAAALGPVKPVARPRKRPARSKKSSPPLERSASAYTPSALTKPMSKLLRGAPGIPIVPILPNECSSIAAAVARDGSARPASPRPATIVASSGRRHIGFIPVLLLARWKRPPSQLFLT